jgi:F0F1-type ATP synthase assembly protein I
MGEQRPAASAVTAGMFLLAALIVCIGLGLGIGWLAGSIVGGAIVGLVLGVPLSFYLVYRQYRDI